MGERGFPPTPTAILETRGSRRAEGRTGEPRLKVKAPSCPAWLPKEAKAEWKRQVKHLLAMRVLAEVDRALLTAWCEAWAELVAITAVIAEMVKPGGLGYMVAVRQGLVNAKNKAVERLLRVAGQFGFSPAARSRLRTVEEEEEKPHAKSRFFGADASVN